MQDNNANNAKTYISALFLLLTSLPNIVFSETIEGKFSCIVTGNTSLTTSQGKSSSNRTLLDGLIIDEELVIAYKLENSPNDAEFTIALQNTSSDKSWNDYKSKDTLIGSGFSFRYKSELTFSKPGFTYSTFLGRRNTSFFNDYIYIEGGVRSLVMKKYDNTSWDALFVSRVVSDTSAYLVTLNCNHTLNSIDEIHRSLMVRKINH
jgi:hypothetical protein